MRHLFVLPFDHRATFAKELLALPYPRLTSVQKKTVSDYKRIVWEGFLKARTKLSDPEELAILVDEEFGGTILKEATYKHVPFALSVEKSGQQLFDFEYGKAFEAHIAKYRPTYAKALVRYNVADAKGNRIQNARLKMLSDFCQKQGIGFMLELLMTGDGSRFKQLKETMQEMIAVGISPAVWKVEGMDTRSQWEQLRGLTDAQIIVLGHGDTKTHVEGWLKTGAKSETVQGFAVGRTVFMKPLTEYRDKKITRQAAIDQIGKNYSYFISLWKKHTT